MIRHLALFQAIRAVIKAERLCVKHGIRCKVIPVPRTISSECGMAIEIDGEDVEAVKGLCAETGISVEFARWERP